MTGSENKYVKCDICGKDVTFTKEFYCFHETETNRWFCYKCYMKEDKDYLCAGTALRVRSSKNNLTSDNGRV